MTLRDEDDFGYPQCEVCFIKENSKWELESVGDDGSVISRLAAIAVPEFLLPGSVHKCCTCGEVTIAGIYVDKDEDEVIYLSEPMESGIMEIDEEDW
jgi:hypothetical protein